VRTIALLCLLAGVCLAHVAKVTVVTHRTENITLLDGGIAQTNYVWQYEATFAEPGKPLPGEYRSSVDSGTNANLSTELKAQIAGIIAAYFKLPVSGVEVTP
jgi:hypothetical protein